MSLGLASQGILGNTGFAPHPSCSRCVSCLQLYSCSEHTSLSSSPLSMQRRITSSLEEKASIQSNVHEPSTSLPPLAAFIPPPVLDRQSCIYTVLHLNISAESQSWAAPLYTLSPHIPPKSIRTHSNAPSGLQTARFSRGTDKSAWQEAAHLPWSV